ncbi:hypothetical protein EVAR_45312_1 [Eumeta japonica]|uniref:Uncharacterized protein n=1 Tax=Eumeta variegata TaxID=151549 RepID=A0A4C1XNW5_EUMVA|nr:hypothetical protein EVAR_45312_1 [Eumeta japonica]
MRSESVFEIKNSIGTRIESWDRSGLAARPIDIKHEGPHPTSAGSVAVGEKLHSKRPHNAFQMKTEETHTYLPLNKTDHHDIKK